ncbi:MAG TPA: carboxypeptidase regulatory-like domain-containing protein [Roseiflexaceae bacterium]|nr:carboxypeptidase regulatory-like domain-containing protein [Roseiflexaceae bacterium]
MRKTLSTALIALGALLVLFGFGGWGTPRVASAQGAVPQPSPRPPVELSDESGRNSTAADITGHVTGTVIDQATGAPVPGATVRVGDVTVTADANGNYDYWVPVGSYTVQVVVDPAQAEAQPPVTVEVRAGEATVQHLTFRSAQAPAAAPTPAPGRVAAHAPTPVAEAAAMDAAAAVTPPKTLPRTGLEPDESWLWIGVGMLLVLMGWLLWGRPVAQLAPALTRPSRLPAGFDRDALLAALLGAKEARPARQSDLLDELLARDAAGDRGTQAPET